MTGTAGITGGCQCGAVRFMAQGLSRATICHCRMCQRATGNAFAPLVSAEDVVFDGEPARFTSSDIADRGFCAACGTPLFYDGHRGQGLSLMVGALDDPNAVEIKLHYGMEARVHWLHLADGLPQQECQPGGLSGAGPATIESYQHPTAPTAKEDK